MTDNELVAALRTVASLSDRLGELGAKFKTLTAAAEAAVRENQLLRNQAGNAVGAIIDSGGYCEGPHDVAAAIYRLTAERDELRAEVEIIKGHNDVLRHQVADQEVGK